MSRTANPPQRAKSVDELCSLWDREFLQVAYWTLLGRALDPAGEAHFLNDLRVGVSKFSILLRIRASAEGRDRDPQLAGLDRALRQYRRATRPYTGWIARLLKGWEGESRSERLQRAIANHFAAISAQNEEEPQHVARTGRRLVGDRQDERVTEAAPDTAAIEQLRLRIVRIEASLKRIEARFDVGRSAMAVQPAARKL